jgi:hypothetical protein
VRQSASLFGAPRPSLSLASALILEQLRDHHVDGKQAFRVTVM